MKYRIQILKNLYKYHFVHILAGNKNDITDAFLFKADKNNIVLLEDIKNVMPDLSLYGN